MVSLLIVHGSILILYNPLHLIQCHRIDHWDNEKERIVLLTEKSMIIAKYDFIAMKQVEYRRIGLSIIDKIAADVLIKGHHLK